MNNVHAAISQQVRVTVISTNIAYDLAAKLPKLQVKPP
ncbi:hypothetical protein PSE_4374 [Pseudovibrio sp. FO-BEG1]|nr:hypothetical protein PSE_4374 [Pseudovibrio sp. FO-BEG1]